MANDELQKLLDQQTRELAGPTPIQKQTILIKLVDLFENQPDEFGRYGIAPDSTERQWISAAGALVRKYDRVHFGSRFDTNVRGLNQLRSVENIVGIVSDVIAEIRLDLELDGRSDIGTIYEPGAVYELYSDLKEIIAGANKEIFLIDPYLNGQAFDEYLGAVRNIDLRLLVSKSAPEIKAYADRHSQQYQTNIEVRRSNELHDRLIIQDRSDVWVIGGSLNMKGSKATYLLPLTPGVAVTARDLYSETWIRSSTVT